MTRRHRWHTSLALAASTTLFLTACGTDGPEIEREPYPVQESLPEADTSTMRLPIPFEDLTVVDPGWDLTPQYADNVHLAAGEHDGVVDFTAVDAHGEPLWAVQRPAGHEGFSVTTDGTGQALAVLGDEQNTTDASADDTATAYDLLTGERTWGPVEVPGPHQGPGLVFAAPSEETGDDNGTRTALDADTGDTAVTDSDTSHIIGEYHGTVLVAESETLIALDTGDGRELWHMPLAEHGWEAESLRASPHPPPADGLALIETSPSGGALLDLEEGVVLNETAQEAAVDTTTDTLVVRDKTGLHAYDADHQRLWSLSVGPETTIAALGGVLLYLREEGSVRVHNVTTGEVAEAYDPQGEGTIIVPEDITADGVALLVDEDRHLLAASPEAGTEGSEP